MKSNDFTQLGNLLKEWAKEQSICKYRTYELCNHPRNNYSIKCGLRQCPNPKARDDKKVLYKKGNFNFFWIQENSILFKNFKI